MATIKKAPGGALIRKAIKAATEAAPKVSKWDYPTQKSRDFQRAFLEAYPEKIKKMPTGTNKIDKVKKVKPSYDKNGLEILKDKTGGVVKKKMKTGGSIPKAQNGKLTQKELDALSHQKRGMGELSNSYVKKSGSIMNDIGYLTNSQKEQLKKHMSKAGTAKKIYEALPNVGRILGHGNSAADIPKGSQLEKQRKGGVVKKKMRNGGSLSGLTASTKRVGPSDKGAFIKVQKNALAGARGKASLTKDKQLGATKMAKRGMSIKKK